MTTIKNVEEFKKQNGKKSWKFTLDDGVVGYITNDKPWEYKAGEQVTYTVEDKGTYNLLPLTRVATALTTSPPASAPPPQQGKISPPDTSAIATTKSFSEMKFEGRLVCIKLAVECILQGKMERKEATEAFSEWVSVLDASIDELKSK